VASGKPGMLENSRHPHESTQQTKLTHTNGTISFAREAPGTATTEFLSASAISRV